MVSLLMVTVCLCEALSVPRVTEAWECVLSALLLLFMVTFVLA